MSKNATGPTPLNLVNSSRLQALRNQSAPGEDRDKQHKSAHQEQPQDAEQAWLQSLIDQKLAKILAEFPANKQRSLFKIRFGIALDELKNLPLKQVAAILKINPLRR